jgi:hypothetical protein
MQICQLSRRVSERGTTCACVFAEVSLLLTLFEATGLLEQNLSSLRAYREKNMSPASLRDSMKVLLDGEPVGFHRGTGYEVTAFGRRVQQTYRKLFGGQTNTPKTQGQLDVRLPRRTLGSRKSSTGLAAFQRHREEQLEKIAKEPTGMSETAARKLCKAVDESAAERATKRQKTLAETLATKTAKKVQLLTEMDAKSQAKLKEAVRTEDDRLKKLSSIQLRDLWTAETLSDAKNILVVAVPTAADADKVDRMAAQASKDLHPFGLGVIPLTAENLVSRIVESRTTIWLGLTQEAEDVITYQNESKPQLVTAMARLLGGYVAGPVWVHACQQTKRLLTPVLQLGRALRVPRQLAFNADVQFRGGILKTIAAVEAHPAGHTLWVVRKTREELSAP